jgi:transposase
MPDATSTRNRLQDCVHDKGAVTRTAWSPFPSSADVGFSHRPKEAYKGRNVVERCFNRLKQWRGIASRSDKTARSYLAGVTLASALIWIKSAV